MCSRAIVVIKTAANRLKLIYRDLKKYLSEAGSNLTENTILRTGRILDILKSICSSFDDHYSPGTHKLPDLSPDIRKASQLLSQADLFSDSGRTNHPLKPQPTFKNNNRKDFAAWISSIYNLSGLPFSLVLYTFVNY